MNLKPLNFRVDYFGIGPVLVACLFALTLTDILWSPMLMHQRYPDPVAGAIGWSDIDKTRDVYAMLLLLGASGVLALGITALGRSIAARDGELNSTINQFLLFTLVPAAYRLAVCCTSTADKLPPLRYLSLFPLGGVLALLMMRRYRDQLSPGDILVVGAAALLAPIMAGFSALGILVALARLINGVIPRIAPYAAMFTICTVVVAIVAIVVIFAFSPTLELFRGRLLRCLRWCQYPSILLIFYLVPPPLVDASKQFRNPYPMALVITLGVIVLVGLGLTWRRFRCKKPDAGGPLMHAIAPAAVVAITIFGICPSAGLPTAFADFFHSGEVLTPWQQIWEYHSIPYVDFAPVHGLMEIVRGALNQAFFDGSVANYTASDALLGGLAVAVLALSTSACISPLAPLFFLLVVLPMDRFYFVAAALFAVATPNLLRRPVRWLGVWLVIGVLSCGYNPVMGPAFVLGTLPIALWQAYRAIRTERLKFGGLILVLAVIAALVFVTVPVRQVVLGFVDFIIDNQWTNDAANGIAWSQGAWQRDRTTGFGTSQFLWELFRFGWIPALIGALVVNWKQWAKAPAERSVPVMVLSASIPLVIFWCSFWVVGRIDSGALSRPGNMTEVALCFLIPALAFVAMPKKHAGITAMLLASLMGLIYGGIPTAIDPDLMIQKPFTTRYIPAGTAMVDGPAKGVPNLGQIIRPDPDFTVNIFNLKKDMSQLLKPGETYFDLSNWTAYYYYLDLPSPGQYAPYVAANSRLQANMMRHVREHPVVPAVLIYPAGELDIVPLSLRCYRPYHDFSLKFTAYQKDGFIFLVDPARNPHPQPIGSEEQLKLLDAAFRREDLVRLPMAWGDSFGAMQTRFDRVASIPAAKLPQPNDARLPAWNWDLPPEVTAGEQADFLRFHCNFVPVDAAAYRSARRNEPPLGVCEPQLALTWTNQDGTVSAPTRFLGESGDLLVPLGAYPRWLLAKGLSKITITLQNPRCAKEITISDLQFLHLKPL